MRCVTNAVLYVEGWGVTLHTWAQPQALNRLRNQLLLLNTLHCHLPLMKEEVRLPEQLLIRLTCLTSYFPLSCATQPTQQHSLLPVKFQSSNVPVHSELWKNVLLSYIHINPPLPPSCCPPTSHLQSAVNIEELTRNPFAKTFAGLNCAVSMATRGVSSMCLL